MSNMTAAAAAYAAETRASVILTGCITPFVIVTFVTFARLYSRGVILKNWGIDDSWICVSWLLALGLVLVNCLLVPFGGSHHQSTIPIKDAVPILKLRFAGRLIYQVVVGTTKASVCFFNLRIFKDRTSRIISYSIIAFIAAYTISLSLVTLLQCVPIQYAWNLRPSGHCRATHVLLVAAQVSGAVSIFTDVVLLVFIIPRILQLHMPRRQKVALLLTVSISILVIAATLIRTIMTVSTAKSHDFSWNSVYIQVWSGIEVAAGLFCASAPAIKPLLRQIAPNLLPSLSGGGSTAAGYSHSKDGTLHSRHGARRQEHIELGSATELDVVGNKKDTHSSVAWRGDDDSQSMTNLSLEDSKSGREVLGQAVASGKIVKTVSIIVADSRPANEATHPRESNTTDDGGRTNRNNIERF